MNEALQKLRAPIHRDRIYFRVGPTLKDHSKGQVLAYIDARVVQDRFDEAVGPENWQVRFPVVTDKVVICEIGVRFGDEWVWKSDGAGYSDIEPAKGAVSDAFKRAAVHWGVARELYALDSPWVPIREAGRSWVPVPSDAEIWAQIDGRKPSTPPPRPQETPPSPAPQERVSTKEGASFGKALADEKKRLGDELYRKTMLEAGFKSGWDVKTEEDRKKVLKALFAVQP